MKNKIKTQRGASITFALLLFLVCAIISSIVIVAATAVGGRASQMAELDQRYYAVNSAAELLRDVLEKQIITVTTGTETEETHNYTKDGDNTNVGTPRQLATEIQKIENGVANTESISDTSLLITAALNLATGVETKPALPSSMLLTQAETKSLEVTMEPKLEGETLEVRVYNTDVSKGTYTLKLIFKASKTVANEKKNITGAKEQTKDESGAIIPGAYKQTIKVIDKYTTTVRWNLIAIQTETAAI